MSGQSKPPVTCNWLHVPQMVRCGKPVVAMIHEAGYCQEHVQKAAAMFGKSTPCEEENRKDKSRLLHSGVNDPEMYR